MGQYNQAFEQVRRGLAVAELNIGSGSVLPPHLGHSHRDLLDLPRKRRHLEESIRVAQEVGSLFHVRQGTAYLTSLLIAHHELDQAATLLSSVFDPDLPVEPLAQRRIWLARAELALAQGDPALALQIVDRLLAVTANVESQEPGAVPYLARLRGEGLAALRQSTEAEAIFRSALVTAQAQGTPRFVWPLHLALGKLLRAQRRHAGRRRRSARTVIEGMAAALVDVELRSHLCAPGHGVAAPTRLPRDKWPKQPMAA
ncbi:MAG: hypothetical protein R2867_17795 [Caldilineaceae bacterium]